MTMTTKKENLSAFLDNESGEFEQRRLLDELREDDSLLQTMSNYTLIGDAIRNEEPRLSIPSDFLAGIHEHLEDEADYHDVHVGEQFKQQKEYASRAWLRPAAGFAVAASVVAVVALNFSSLFSPNHTPVIENSNTMVVSTTSRPTVLVASAKPLFMAKSTTKTRLQRYIKSHVKHTPSSAIMPSIRSFSHAKN